MINITSMLSTLVINTTDCLPVQGVKGSSSTHPFITDQAISILNNDGNKKAAQFFNIFERQLDSGIVWVDKGLNSAFHYYNPDNGTGIWLWPSAAEKCAGFFHKSLGLWQRKEHALSMFFLGAAIHLIQDVCVPHHAACQMFNNHLDYEHWVEKRKGNYLVDSKGIYGISNKPEEWIIENARVAKKHFHLVEKGVQGGYHMATTELLTRAQRTTAGFLLNYFCQL